MLVILINNPLIS